MKPKLWDGPNPVGEARARFNETLDTPYTTASGPGFTAKKSGDFSEVSGETPPLTPKDPILFASGLFGETWKKRGATSTSQSFAVTPIRIRTRYLGRGYSSELLTTDGVSRTEERTVSAHRNGASPTVVSLGYVADEKYAEGFRRASLGAFATPTETAHLDVTIFNLPEYAASPLGTRGYLARLHETQSVTTGDDSYFLFHSRMTDSLNEWGYPVARPAFLKVSGWWDTAAASYLPLPPDAVGTRDYVLGPAFQVSPGKLVAFVGEMPNLSKEVPAVLATSQGRILQYVSTDNGTSWSLSQFTGLDFSVTPLSGTPERFFGEYEYDTDPLKWAATSTRIDTQGIRICDFTSLTKVAVFTPKVWTLFTTVGDYRTYADGYSEWRVLGFRTTDAGLSWAMIDTPFTGKGDALTKPTYIMDPVILRDGVCLIRATQRFPATGTPAGGSPVTFFRSSDYGLTWEVLAPTGLPANTTSRLGYFKVLSVHADADGEGEVSKVAITAYNDETSEYRMHVSEDDGDSWDKSYRISTSSDFVRVDGEAGTWDTSTNLGNMAFGVLHYVGEPKDKVPIDVAQPWRFDATITPPSS